MSVIKTISHIRYNRSLFDTIVIKLFKHVFLRFADRHIAGAKGRLLIDSEQLHSLDAQMKGDLGFPGYKQPSKEKWFRTYTFPLHKNKGVSIKKAGKLSVWFFQNHIGFQWYFGNQAKFMHAGFTIGNDEEQFQCSLALYRVFAIYFTIDRIFTRKFYDKWFHKNKLWSGLTTDIRFFDYTIWVSSFMDESGHTSMDINKWFQFEFNIDFRDLLFGKFKTKSYKTKPIAVEIEITPNEKYIGTYIFKTIVRRRKRWFTEVYKRIEIEVEEGIPYPGKGTSSYNCGDDAVFSFSTPGESVKHCIDELRKDVLWLRKNYPL